MKKEKRKILLKEFAKIQTMPFQVVEPKGSEKRGDWN